MTLRHRTFVLLGVALVLLAGCSSPAAAPQPTTAGPLTVQKTLTPRPAASGGHPASAQPADGSTGPVVPSEVHLVLALSNNTVSAAQPLEVTLTATQEVDGQTQPFDAPWRLTFQRDDGTGTPQEEHGDALPGRATLRAPTAGSWSVTGTVTPDGYEPASVGAAFTVLADAAGCQRATGPVPAPVARKAIDLGSGSGEPNIAVAPDGTLYVTPIQPLFRSTDQGATWSRGGATDGGGDGDIAVSATGRLHWFGLGTGVPYQHSDDQGGHFTRALDLSEGGAFDREWIDAVGTTIHTSWRDNDGNIDTRTSFDDGETWGPIHAMGPDGVGGPLTHGPGPGSVYEAVTSGNTIIAYVSHDDGATWDHHDAAQLGQGSSGDPLMIPSAIFPVVSVDCAGTLYLVYADLNGELPTEVEPRLGRYAVFLRTSHDDGATWSAPRMLSSPGHAALMAFVAAGGPGQAAAVWYENVVGAPSESIPDEWNVKLWTSTEADQPQGQGVVTQLNTDPNHIGSVCTSGLLCVAGGDRSLLDFFEVALTPEGRPVVTWMSSTAGTGLGLAAQGPDVWFGGLSDGPRLR